MSGSTTHLPQIEQSQLNHETVANANANAMSPAALFGLNVDTTEGLYFGLIGGMVDVAGTPTWVDNQVVLLTGSATNYISHTDGVVSKVTVAPAGWPGPLAGGAVALYDVVTNADQATSWNDYRVSAPGGGGAGGGSTAADVSIADAGGYYTGTDVEAALQEIGADLAVLTATADADTDQVFTSDTGSTADADPGNGLFTWNNATQASATALYVDNQTAAGVSMATFFAALPADGFIHLVQEDDATKWQLWKWSGLPTAGAGYYKFTGLTLMASGGSIADAKSTAISFKGTTPSTQPVLVNFFYPGVPGASALLGIFAAPASISTITFAASISGSAGKALTAATAQTDIDVRKNATTAANGTSVGTVRFAAAGTVPTFIAASGFTLTGGSDWLTLWAPASADATLANIGIDLAGTR